MEEESADFIGTHFARVPELMKADVMANLVQIAVLGAETEVAQASDLTNIVQKLRYR